MHAGVKQIRITKKMQTPGKDGSKADKNAWQRCKELYEEIQNAPETENPIPGVCHYFSGPPNPKHPWEKNYFNLQPLDSASDKTQPIVKHCQQLLIQMNALIKSLCVAILKFDQKEFDKLREAAIVRHNELTETR